MDETSETTEQNLLSRLSYKVPRSCKLAFFDKSFNIPIPRLHLTQKSGFNHLKLN